MLISFGFYLLLLLGVSFYAYQKTKSVEDYILGGRRLGAWTSALSAGASDMSGWLLLGLPGYAYLAGLEAFWLALGLLLGSYLNWQLIAKPLRSRSGKFDSITIPDFLSKACADNSGVIKITASLFILFFYIFYTASGLVAAGKLFESVFAIHYHYAVICGTLLITFYTSFGGYLAVSWSDLFQGLLMFFALGLLCAFCFYHGGEPSTLQTLYESHHHTSLNFMQKLDGSRLSLITLVSLLAWGLGYFGQPHILCRFMSIRNEQLISSSRNIAISWTGLCLLMALFLGMAGTILLPNTLHDSQSETVILELIPFLLNPVFSGVCLAAILAAIMSTVDSQLLIAASSISHDLLPDLSQRVGTQQTRLSRIIVVICALLALTIALNNDASVLDLVSYAWGGFGAVFGPLMILLCLNVSIRPLAAIIGMCSGGIGIICFKFLQGGWFDVYELLPAFVLSFAVTLLINRMTA